MMIPVGVLTNNPPFDFQMLYLDNFMNITAEQAVNRFSEKMDLKPYSLGMGGLGLPGDLSSSSRFVKAAFTKMNSVSGDSEMESVSQFFHILGAVEQQRGCVKDEKGQYEVTVYSSCCNTDRGIYYYTTYENRQITGVDMHREDLAGQPVDFLSIAPGTADKYAKLNCGGKKAGHSPCQRGMACFIIFRQTDSLLFNFYFFPSQQ